MPFGLPLGLRLRRGALMAFWPRWPGKRATRGAVADAAITRRLDWIADFWRQLSPYAYVRAEDSVLIVPPNLVYKTNASGVGLIQYLERGGRLVDLPGLDAGRAAAIEAFFLDIKAVSEGRSPRLEQVAYDFDFTALPVLGEIAVTYRCNNRCRFCYAGCAPEAGSGPDEADQPAAVAVPCAFAGRSSLTPMARDPQGSGDELDTAGLKKIIDLFRTEAKIPFFSFTGGEPLLRADLEELIAYSGLVGLRVNLVSNGTLATAARAASLKAAGLTTAQVSLEAPDASLHDQLCGRAGSFAQTVAGIGHLLAAGIRVQTNTTVTALNRACLPDLPAFVKSLGVDRMAMNLFIPAGTGLHDAELLVPYSQAGAVVDAVRARALALGMEFFWYSPTPLCLYNPIAKGLGNKSCAACDGLISVAPNGDVLPCSSWPEAVGNLLSDGFRATWFGPTAQALKHKEYAPAACRQCGYFTACQAACPLYWRVCGYAELENSGQPVWQQERARSGQS
ncbi:MAG: hypothetical protein A2087_14125 [Spirochaetes bacterium GWD1_61_31]|nr:MAG: hypothetical protein A2087_14125 [Spirochaetes bacterium GWD1_61_31]OHD43842.1 MAG: hypothetical protein A2Y35_00335 [Spirochaetes bacterium GWE1_60_18]HCQ88326.1 radical SAM protein [Spirochaetaceae bacterium]